MNAFWSGVVASLVGAVVGGAFAAAAAVLQVRGAAKAAYRQAELASRAQLELARSQEVRQAIYELKKTIFDIWHFFDDLHNEHDVAVKRSAKGTHFVIESERKGDFHSLYRKAFVARGLYEHLLPAGERKALDDLTELLSEEEWLLLPQQRSAKSIHCCRLDECCWAVADHCAALGLGDPPRDARHLDG
ncbi:hypothetical protein [Micromonospora sp. NBC_00858]|uniref:hypothetical protein n=1 Tax=Micromonospora sp. NBC_00858 TaxID=2975979 RepID=UPI00386C595E|nr:hypothetical protein OG990_01485 [Micromonospora sp. NBC_00858]